MKFWNAYLKVVIIECIAASILIIFSFVLKFGFVKTFVKVKEWYISNVMVDTDVYEVIE